MATERWTAKNGEFVLISMAPDVCFTPVGDKSIPLPYPITHNMDKSEQCSTNVFIEGKPAFLHNTSYVDNAEGDAPGSDGGIVTGVTGKVSHSIFKSDNLFVNGKHVVRTGDQVFMNTKKP